MVEPELLARLEASFEATPADTALAVSLAGELARHGRRVAARQVLVGALDAGAEVRTLAEAAARLGLERWSGGSGGWPLRTWLGRAPQATPRVVWDEKVVRADLRHGRPCIVGSVLGVVARSTVVGGRFVELFAYGLERGEVLWRREVRNIIAPSPMFALEADGQAPALGWAYAVGHDDGVELVVEVYDAATGAELARHGHRLEGAQIVADESGPVPLPGGDLAWVVSWLDDDARHDVLFVIDGGSGEVRGPLGEVDAAQLRDAARAPVSFDAAAGTLWVDAWPAPPSGEAALLGLCASPQGARFAAVQAATAGWQLARLDVHGAWHELAPLFPSGLEGAAAASVSACWMGGDLVLGTAHGRETVLWACRAHNGAPLWQIHLEGLFHTVPVPMPDGVLALGGERIVALRS